MKDLTYITVSIPILLLVFLPTAESEPEKGSKFILQLPLEDE